MSTISLIAALVAALLHPTTTNASNPPEKRCVPHTSCADWKTRLPGLKQASRDSAAAIKNQDKSCAKGEDRAACQKRVAEEVGRLAGAQGFADGSRDAVAANIANYCCEN